MLAAIKKAREGIKKGQTPFGACIVKNRNIISCTNNAVWKNTDITAHAEIHAIRSACKKLKTIDLSGCVIYSTTEPCPMCFSACHWAKISKIVYGTRIEDARKAGFHELAVSDKTLKKTGHSPVKLKGGFLRKECLGLLREWRRRKDRKVY